MVGGRRDYLVGFGVAAATSILLNYLHFRGSPSFTGGLPFTFFKGGGPASGGGFVWSGVALNALVVLACSFAIGRVVCNLRWKRLLRLASEQRSSNGETTQDWSREIERAQELTHYPLGDRMLGRVRYGDERDDWDAENVPCHDCAVLKGQFHVPSCDVEECPNCRGQRLSCDCEDGDACTPLRS